MRVSQPDKLEQPPDHRPLERGVDLGERVIVAVDRPPLAGPLDRDDVVLAREQPDVIDLRDALREQLDCPRGEVPLVVAPERRVSTCS